ncbi:MAG: glycosyltransferase [Chloroflexota bacterium]|nr:glycosyltransferase [Chloroflexota bacterium]
MENVLMRTSDHTKEIVLWDNASDHETREYVDSLKDPRIRVIHHPTNIAQNAHAFAFPLTSASHLIQVDDDVIDAPERWDEELMLAFDRLPQVGYLATNLVNNKHDITSQIMYGKHAHLYSHSVVSGVELKLGPVGGWCSMTSREIYDRVGGFGQNKKFAYWYADEDYIERIGKHGYRTALLDNLKVVHAGGSYYSDAAPEKTMYRNARRRRHARRQHVKRLLLVVPGVAYLNERFRWFKPPATTS